MAGPQITANYTATNAEVRPTLGRDLSAGATTVTIPIIQPQTMFEDRISRLDMRVGKIFRFGRLRVQANLDAYNVLNASSVRAINTNYGAAWLTPTQILDPRLLQISGQVSF